MRASLCRTHLVLTFDSKPSLDLESAALAICASRGCPVRDAPNSPVGSPMWWTLGGDRAVAQGRSGRDVPCGCRQLREGYRMTRAREWARTHNSYSDGSSSGPLLPSPPGWTRMVMRDSWGSDRALHRFFSNFRHWYPSSYRCRACTGDLWKTIFPEGRELDAATNDHNNPQVAIKRVFSCARCRLFVTSAASEAEVASGRAGGHLSEPNQLEYECGSADEYWVMVQVADAIGTTAGRRDAGFRKIPAWTPTLAPPRAEDRTQLLAGAVHDGGSSARSLARLAWECSAAGDLRAAREAAAAASEAAATEPSSKPGNSARWLASVAEVVRDNARDFEVQAQMMAGFARELAAIGDPQGAGEYASLAARAAAEAIGYPRDRTNALVGSARVLSDMGATSEVREAAAAARHAADLIISVEERDRVLGAIAEVLAASGFATEALSASRAIDNLQHKDRALARVSAVLAGGKEPKGALAAAIELDDPLMRVWALGLVAAASVEDSDSVAGREAISRARAVADGAPDPAATSNVFREISIRLARLGGRDAASDALDAIGSPGARAEARALVAAALVGAGDQTGARDIALSAKESASAIGDPRDRAMSLVRIASVLGELGELPAARDALASARTAADEVSEGFWRSYTLKDVAQAFASLGDTTTAREIADAIDEPSRRGDALLAVAEAFAGAGDLSSASEAVGAAKDAAVESGKYSMSYALRGVAQTQAMLGDAEAAHDSARLIDDRSEGVLTLARVAEVLAEHGDTSMAAEAIASALAEAEQLETPGERVRVLLTVAKTSNSLGNQQLAGSAFKAARQAATLMDDRESRAKALNDVARFLASVDCESAARKAASAARKLAATASGEVWASFALRDAAGILAELGDAKAARDAAIAIDDPESQAKALLRVAKAQIDAGDLAAARATACEARVAARMVPFGGAGRSDLLTDIAKDLATVGKAVWAREVADAVDGSDTLLGRAKSERDQAVGVVAVALAAVGDAPAAWQSLARIDDPDMTARFRLQVVRALFGDQEDSRPLPIVHPRWGRAGATPTFNEVIAAAEDATAARVAADRALDRSLALARVAEVLDGLGDSAEALAAVKEARIAAHSARERSSVLGRVVEVLKLSSDSAVTRAVIAQAEKIVQEAADEVDRLIASLGDVEEGDSPEALHGWSDRLAESMSSPPVDTPSDVRDGPASEGIWDYATALVEVAEALATAPITPGKGHRLAAWEKTLKEASLATNPAPAPTPPRTPPAANRKAPQGKAPDQRSCFIATAVYGTYDCPEVRVLRRWRDTFLITSGVGRQFVRSYYATSPTVVGVFGKRAWCTRILRCQLDRLVSRLEKRGYSSREYSDPE